MSKRQAAMWAPGSRRLDLSFRGKTNENPSVRDELAGLYMTRSATRIFVIFLVLSLATFVQPTAGIFEIDAVTNVTRVIDGDTFVTSSRGTIRLADIDTPEQNQTGYHEAKIALSELVSGKEVSLDIDDKTGADQFDRLVCVVYVRFNSTHLTNVNKALLDRGYAALRDFSNNEFDPRNWNAYEYSLQNSQNNPALQTIPFESSMVILFVLLVIIVVGVVAVGYLARRPK